MLDVNPTRALPAHVQAEEPHVAPIHELLRELRAGGQPAPSPDPENGGIFGRLLILLESPGPKALESGLISLNNNDESARNLKKEVEAAGLAKRDLLAWNAVPFAVGETPVMQDILDSMPITQGVVDAMVNLKVVIFCGETARKCGVYLNLPRHTVPLCTSHSGAKAYNRPQFKAHMRRTFETAKFLLDRL